MKTAQFRIIAAMLLVFLCFAADGRRTIAVSKVKTFGVPSDLGLVVRDFIQNNLQGSKSLRLVETDPELAEQVTQILENNQRDMCDHNECTVEVGRALQVEKMLAASLSLSGTKYTLTLKVIDISTFEVEYSDSEAASCRPDDLDILARRAAYKLRIHFGDTGLTLPVINALPPITLGENAEDRSRPGMGNLRVTTTPAGADVYLDDRLGGKSPLITYLTPGSYSITIILQGYSQITEQVTVIANRTTLVERKLSRQEGTDDSVLPLYGRSPMVEVRQGLWIDKFEVSNHDYQVCVDAGSCTLVPPIGGPTNPVVSVDLSQSEAYCKWAGKRLPTSNEWMEAAGGQERLYPTGKSIDCNQANSGACRNKSSLPVDSLPSGASPCGALNMAGNVWERTSDGLARGGSFKSSARQCQISYWRLLEKDRSADDVGFRCVRQDD